MRMHLHAPRQHLAPNPDPLAHNMCCLRNSLTHGILLLAPVLGFRTVVQGGLPAHEPLCSPDVVAETCSKISRRRPLDRVHFSELGTVLHVTFDSIASYMDFIEIPFRETLAPWTVLCSDLCAFTVRSLPSSHVPPATDWACYDLGGDIKCDVDVSDEAFETWRNKYGLLFAFL